MLGASKNKKRIGLVLLTILVDNNIKKLNKILANPYFCTNGILPLRIH